MKKKQFFDSSMFDTAQKTAEEISFDKTLGTIRTLKNIRYNKAQKDHMLKTKQFLSDQTKEQEAQQTAVQTEHNNKMKRQEMTQALFKEPVTEAGLANNRAQIVKLIDGIHTAWNQHTESKKKLTESEKHLAVSTHALKKAAIQREKYQKETIEDLTNKNR